MSNEPDPTKAEFLLGKRIVLRAVEEGDIAWLHAWANDPETRGLTGAPPSSHTAAVEYYQKVQKDESRV